MDYIRIIPSLILSEKKLVKGVKFTNHRIAGNPVSTIKALESQKADEILLVDIDSYKKKRNGPDLLTLESITKEMNTPLTFGGGIDSFEIAKKVIKLGVEKIYLNRSVLYNEINIKKLVEHFGGQAIVIGLNLININGQLLIYEKQDENLFDYIKKIQDLGVGEFKITFVDREGTNLGPDLNNCKILKEIVNISTIFEGGIGKLDHLSQLVENGINSIALGSMIIFSDYNIFKIKTYLKNINYLVRM